MLGLLFYKCNEFGLVFRMEDCNLSHSSFYQTKIRKTSFVSSILNEVDFTECDLTNSILDRCDLLNAKFENSILGKVDFRSSFNYSIDPEANQIKKARFSMAGLPGLLDKYEIEIE